MKRKILTIIAVGFITLLVGCGGNKVDDPTSEKYIAQAKKIINLLNEEDYEGVHVMFDSEMEAGLSVENMQDFTPIIQDSGDFKEINKESIEERDGYYVTVLVAKYSNDNRIYTITFNNNDEIAGLYIQ